MDCDTLDDLIEGFAEGEPPGPEAGAHLASCARCQGRLAAARAIDRLLAAREAVEPAPGFTGRVMARVAEDQWRAEQIVDVGFNLAIACGLALIAAGAAGLAWAFGWLGFDQPTLQLVGAAVEPWLLRAAAEARTVALAAVLLTSALGFWWWVEAEATS